MVRVTLGLLAALLASGCATRHPPARAVTTAGPQGSADWFERQLAAARVARRNHQPAGDAAGAQRDYDDVLRSACARLALGGTGAYRSQCDAVLRQPERDPAACQDSGDPSAVAACND